MIRTVKPIIKTSFQKITSLFMDRFEKNQL
jgi:hypothetical protein